MHQPPAGPVFVVDDEDTVRSSLARLLRVIGFESVTYPSAEAFLEAWTPDQGGCLLVDIRMPGMSGLDLIETLRKRGFDPPVIVMTGQTDENTVKRVQSLQPLGFLEKPFSVEQLKDVLERWQANQR